MENKQTHPMQLALPLSPPTTLWVPELLRSQALGVLAQLLLQVAQAQVPGVPGVPEKGAEHAP